MKKNLGMIDRLLRAAIAIAVVILYFAGQITGTAAAILGAPCRDLPGDQYRGLLPRIQSTRYFNIEGRGV